MEYIKENKKLMFQVLFLFLLFSATFYALFKGRELDQIWNSVLMAKKGYLLFGIVLVIVFVCSESVIIWHMMRSLGKTVPLRNCIKYSFIGFFYSCITPSASGGQPAQIYYMKQDEIEVPVSTLVLMIVTITYKFVLVLIGIFLLLFCSPLIDTFLSDTKIWFYLGIFLNVGCVTLMCILIFMPRLTKKLMHLGLSLLEHIRLLKRRESRRKKLSDAMEKYKESSYYFREHKMIVVQVLLISIFQRCCLFYATYIVYRAFGLNQHSAFDIVVLQATISIAVDMLPLPGGMGASEALFMSIFNPIFGAALVLPGMLLSRGISYYALLLISAAVTIFAHISAARTEIRKRNQGGKRNVHRIL